MMNNLSYTQEFFLCAVNGKGDIAAFDSGEFATCMIAGGITELAGKGFIFREENGCYTAAKPWDDSLPYLKPLYEKIVSFNPPKGVEGVADLYISNHKTVDELVSAFGISLTAAGCMYELQNQGLRKNKTKYIPKPEAVTDVVEKILGGFPEGGAVSDETLCLAALFDGGNLIRKYFNKAESNALKTRFKEMDESGAYASVIEIIDIIGSIIAGAGTVAASAAVAD